MNLEQLRQNQHMIERVINSHKNLGQVATLVAVTKTVGTEMMEALYENGIRHFGENRPNVFVEKYRQLTHLDKAVWHYIGNLQTRQVKDVINEIDYLHSLDRPSLAKEIQKRAQSVVNCFVQVNVSGEASKSGFKPEEVVDWIESIADYHHIRVVGLMTMAPINATEAALRQYFGELKQLQTQIEQMGWLHAPCTELSMGMSQDYEIAVEEGATFVRVGTAFFEGVYDE